MELWSGILSPFSAKVRIALAEKQLAYTHREIPWTRKNRWGPKPEAFRALSPRGEVPVLALEGLAVVDSTVILEYLEEAHPDVPLYPKGPRERAEARMWEDMGDHFCKEHLTVLIREVFLDADADGRDAAAQEAALAAYRGFHAHLDRTLANRAFLCSDFGVADVSVYVSLGFAASLGAGFDPALSHLADWAGRVASRPAVAHEFEAIAKAAAAA
ncbi:MAG: glutathione S-transferase family protein [Myxococcota bacterium]